MGTYEQSDPRIVSKLIKLANSSVSSIPAMSTVCPVGIDFGNVCTVMSAFQMNEKEPLKSTTLIVKDRNGSNCPSYFCIV